MKKRNDLEDRLINFSTEIVAIAESIPKTGFGIYLADQLMRAGVSPSLNYGEAQGANSYLRVKK